MVQNYLQEPERCLTQKEIDDLIKTLDISSEKPSITVNFTMEKQLGFWGKILHPYGK